MVGVRLLQCPSSTAREAEAEAQRHGQTNAQDGGKHSFIENLFYKHPLCARLCSGHWDTAVSQSPHPGLRETDIQWEQAANREGK